LTRPPGPVGAEATGGIGGGGVCGRGFFGGVCGRDLAAAGDCDFAVPGGVVLWPEAVSLADAAATAGEAVGSGCGGFAEGGGEAAASRAGWVG
jgi:hypothetical protein